ncbi:hypothetical protein HRbin36_01052 [bacterium HR36]|nr:hypothetical protein HRbin36_01052 [bacterium HR36]
MWRRSTLLAKCRVRLTSRAAYGQRCWSGWWVFLAAMLLAVICPGGVAQAQEAVSFERDVMAVLSRAGCNQGVCHGNQNGKGGFKLSLRGESPDWDYQALTRDSLGRRVNPIAPEQSLLLLKPTGAVPHEGGQRFSRDSESYRILHRWIASGMPRRLSNEAPLLRLELAAKEMFIPWESLGSAVVPKSVPRLTVRAVFADGAVREVTSLAVFEPSDPRVRVLRDGVVACDGEPGQLVESAILVRYMTAQAVARIAFVPPERLSWPEPWRQLQHPIDRLCAARWQRLHLVPAEICDDTAFLRRAYLDLLGQLPEPEEVRAFLSDSSPDKRAQLIDRLLNRPEFAEYWAMKWGDLLRVEEKALDRKGVQVFHRWIRQAIETGMPLNEMARQIVAAQGSTYSVPPANFYRAIRDPMNRAEAVAQVFLGLRIQCARCHNHPFDTWTQDDYHALTAFFARIQYRVLENNRRDRFDLHEFDGEQIVWQDRQSEWTHPRTGQPVLPRLPGTASPVADLQADRLRLLADWLADPGNPYFARAQVNRVWYHLFGRGLVEPIDDFRASNPASQPEVLDWLARDFAAHHFDLRHLLRTIMTSQTYQLSSRPNQTNSGDDRWFSRSLERPLQAEQLADALAQVIGVPLRFASYPDVRWARQLPAPLTTRRRDAGPTTVEAFLKVFGKPARLLTCECERTTGPTMSQALQMISGEMINAWIAAPDNRLGRLLAAGKSDAEILEELYLAALSRFPTAQERQQLIAWLASRPNRRAAFEDLLWSLVNAKEFLLRY